MAAPAIKLLMAAAGAGAPLATSGHGGVAAWVAANSSKVIEYWQMTDFAGDSFELSDIGTGRNLGFQGGYTTGTIDGETAADFNGSTGYAGYVDQADWDNIAGIFLVVQFDNNAGGSWHILVDRDDGLSRQWQFRRNNNGRLEFQQIGGGVVTREGTTSTLTSGNRYTLGCGMVGGSLKLYVNGSPESTSGGSPTIPTGSAGVGIARNSFSGGNYVDGKIASVVLLNTCSDTIMSDLHAAWV